MIAIGKYPAKVIRRQWGYTEGGKEQILLEFEITGETDETGNRLPWFGYFTDKTWARTMEALRSCGWEGDDLANLGELSKEVEIVVEHEEDDQGNVRAKVRWVNRLSRIELKKPMRDAQLLHFAAAMKSRARDSGSRPRDGKGRRPPREDFDDVPPPGDDIPF